MKKYLLLILMLLILGISNVSALEIPVNSYVIGEYLFTREGSDIYDGVLTTDYLMLASKSISSKDLDDMVIYFKINETDFINGATGELIDDTFLERDLIDNIKYYDMKKIPSVRIAYEGKYGTSMPEGSDGIPTGYSFDYNVYDKDEENNLDVGVDFYGSSDINLNASELSIIYYPGEEEFSDMNLTLMSHNTSGLSGNVGTCVEFTDNPQYPDVAHTNSKYTVFAYPYVNVVNRDGQSKKVYLEFEPSNLISVRNDLMVNRTFENGEVKVSVVDSSGKKYKINSVLLYKTFEDAGEHNYFDAFDLLNLYKQHNTLKEMLDKNTFKALEKIQEQYNNKHLEIVDLYAATTDLLKDEIVMHDLGNSENVTSGVYGIYVQVIDEDDKVYDVGSAHVSWDTSIVLQQPTIDDNYINGEESSYDLLQLIALLNMILSMSE